MKNIRALVLLSGGLDSMLAARVLRDRGAEVVGLSFSSCFFNTEKAKKAAEQLGIELIEVDFSEEHLAMVKNPKCGYGKNMNPCIDCHGMMFRRANEFLSPPTPPLRRGANFNLISNGRHLPYNPKLIEKAREMRNNPTLAEKKLWYDFLRNHEYKFLRQRPIDNFIVDFYCSELKLIVEVDGETHMDENERETMADKNRTKILGQYGLEVLRFWNNEVVDEFDFVVEKISQKIQNGISLIKGAASTFAPLSKGGLGGFSFDFIATGEVLGQRPMSQNMESLKKVEKLAGLENKILRPLSAKLLEETEAERNGLIDRAQLLDISGRSRRRQTDLAFQYGIKEYPSPAGGCLLTDPAFSKKLVELFKYWPDCGPADVEILKHGRIFWFKSEKNAVLAVIGRKESENNILAGLARPGDVIMELQDETGPTTLMRSFNFKFSVFNDSVEADVPLELDMGELKLEENKSEEEIFRIAAVLTGYYSVRARGKKVKVKSYKVIK